MLAHCPALRELDGARLFVSGGTGFFGIWLLESLFFAADAHDLHVEVVALSRDPGRFQTRAPWLAERRELSVADGDVRQLPALAGSFSHVIHGATSTTGPIHADPLALFQTIVDGTRGVLSAVSGSLPRLLFVSSGAVYGRQPVDLPKTPESYRGAPDPMDATATYGIGKRSAEHLVALAAARGLPAVVARAFAFIGPHLPLDAHFAVGNFIRDALDGGPIVVQGDGTPLRSYLYASDLVVWLWTLLLRGKAGCAYNVGSDEALTIGELANQVGRVSGCTVQTTRAAVVGQPPERYVPDITRARTELALAPRVSLESAVARTLAWHHDARRGAHHH